MNVRLGILVALGAMLGACSPHASGTLRHPSVEHAESRDEESTVGNYQPADIAGMLKIEDKGYFYSPAKWPAQPDGQYVIPVCWEPGTPNGPERGWVKSAILETWQDYSKRRLRFIGWGDCAGAAAGIRIGVEDIGPKNGPRTMGLGKQLDSQPNGMILNFTFRTWSPSCAATEDERKLCIRAIAVHEFGHAIGLAHEHNRPDTPGECKKKPQGDNGDIMLTPWDRESVMNYCNSTYNNNGNLSNGDKDTLLKAYGS